jgi:SPX domain protein involved in polyphosphate accumulation
MIVPTTTRHECKYLVSPAEAVALRSFARPFVQPDRHARGWPGGRYPVCSLYLDSPDLRLARETQDGCRDRFKLRIRSYSDEATAPAFLEIKQRHDGSVRKSRARLDRDRLKRFLEPGGDAPRGDVPADLGRFVMQMRSVGARPTARVVYEREAYESSAAEPVRVTFDTGLRFADTREYELAREGAGFLRQPGQDVVLEVKFNDAFPGWVDRMISSFGLQRRSFSKYLLGLELLGGAPGHHGVPGPLRRLG